MSAICPGAKAAACAMRAAAPKTLPDFLPVVSNSVARFIGFAPFNL